MQLAILSPFVLVQLVKDRERGEGRVGNLWAVLTTTKGGFYFFAGELLWDKPHMLNNVQNRGILLADRFYFVRPQMRWWAIFYIVQDTGILESTVCLG